MSRFRPLAVPAIASLLALSVLIGLGSWQLQRRDWKLALIERIETRSDGETVSLSYAKNAWDQSRDVEYYRILLLGRFLHDHERHLYTVVDGKAGWRVLTPFRTYNDDVILVDRGFVPEIFRQAATRASGQIEGTQEIIALARAPGAASWFTPENQSGANRWFWRDVEGLAASLPAEIGSRILPFMAEAERMDVPGGWPRSGVTRLNLSNRHLEYAVTWFGLALTLIGVFGFYARHRLRQGPAKVDQPSIADQGGSV